jgi:Fur family ferric uptake transcriptional regulator
MHAHKTLKDRIRAAGLRATPGRLALAEWLEHAHQPVGTPALAEQFVPSEFDLATLYRTLKSFEEKNLVRSVTIDTRFASYEWVEDEDSHHHHLVCKNCGLIVEIPPCDLSGLEKKVLAETSGFAKITSHSLEFFGICRNCLKKG